MSNHIEQASHINTQPNYVVAIGASAGGLEALEELFSVMPLDTGMSFVVVQHLSPDYKSMMDELLARKTALPVLMAKDQMSMQRDAIYLLPPQKEMMVSNGKLLLTERDANELLNLPINIFFNSLAESYQDKGIAIVLSGTGSDGTKGIQAVHDSGGMVIAQSLSTCRFDSMPKNAIDTHKVDLILSPAYIPQALVKFSKRNDRVDQQIAAGELNLEESQFTEILLLINNRFELDFSQYKMSTITRRIERRMSMLSLSSLKEYTKVLLEDNDELEAMYFDLLIGVTQFFRDPEAFAYLKQSLTSTLQSFATSNDRELRIWVAACATGEEAYSMAMLIYDLNQTLETSFNFKIFATDVHRNSIKKAALGIYSEANLKGLDDDLKSRFFMHIEKDHFQINADLRKHIVFAQHNITKDAPFTKTHIISCRNMLIYFNLETQKKILSLLTFSLKSKGILFLGPSETLGRHANDFKELNSTHKIYQKMRESHRRPPLGLENFTPRALPSITRNTDRDYNTSVKSKKALNILLQRHVPPSLLINSVGDILHAFGDAGDYLKVTPGESTMNLRAMVSGPAKAVVIHMLNQVNKSQKKIQTRFVEGFAKCINADIAIQPLSDSPADAEYLLVEILPNNGNKELEKVEPTEANNVGTIIPNAAFTTRVTELEDELQFTRESLQTTVEELETSNEELQSSNEELMASNEELQSTNEELQSVNEELVTVNYEFQEKEKERAEIARVVESSGLGIIFLDNKLCIRRFSDTAAAIFHLVQSDFGRPLAAVSGQFIKDIIPDIREVIQTGGTREQKVVHEEGITYQMRIHRIEEVIEAGSPSTGGVILTFSDITKLSTSQAQLEQSEERFHIMIDALSDGYFEWKPKRGTLYVSDALKSKLGYPIDAQPDWSQLLTDEAQSELEPLVDIQAGISAEKMIALKHQNGDDLWMLCKYHARQEPDRELCLEGHLIDMQAFKRLEADLQSEMKKLQRSNDILEEFAYIVSHDLKAPLRHSLHTLEYFGEARLSGEEKEQDKHINNLRRYLQSLQALINDVIRFSRFRTQKASIAENDITQIIEEVRPILESNFSPKKIELHIDKLPMIACDQSMMRHLVQNLLHNACKYNENETINIHILFQRNASTITIIVKDNGIGFDERFTEDIFKPFKRLVTKNQFEGSGVGLAICKTIIELHNGSLTANSRIGEGSEFLITLPIRKS